MEDIGGAQICKTNLACIVNAYSFIVIKDVKYTAQKIRELAKSNSCLGSALVAPEGVNLSFSGLNEKVRSLTKSIWKLLRPKEVIEHFTYCPFEPFSKLKVMIKEEIVKLNVHGIDMQGARGEYITPGQWEEFIAQEDVMTIDTRNNYEYLEGRFARAIDPATETFNEFPAWAQANIEKLRRTRVAMYCTGGIRCEKASAYMVQKLGLRQVYQLQGGILEYLRQKAEEDQSWSGECFVFDGRSAVNRSLKAKAM